jgi:hypothetical protein
LSGRLGPTDEDRAAAWDLYTELRTRITCQPLHYLAGDEQTALESVATLFKQARELIHQYGAKSRHFTTITVFTLNRVVRPFTAKWHKAVTDGRLKNEDVRHQLREELVELQGVLRKFCTVLAALAEGDAFVPGSESWPAAESPVDYSLGGSIPFQILFDGNVPLEQQQAIRWREHNEIRRRRGLPELKTPDRKPLGSAAGGRRAAQGCGGLGNLGWRPAFGHVRAGRDSRTGRKTDAGPIRLSVHRLRRRLSRFVSQLVLGFAAPGCRGGRPEQLPFHKPPVGETAALRHLRAHSKFLLTGGLMGRLNMVLQATYGLLANMVIVLAWLLTAVVIVDLLDRWNVLVKNKSLRDFATTGAPGFREYWHQQQWLGYFWLIVAGLLLFMPLVLRLFRGAHRAWWVKSYQGDGDRRRGCGIGDVALMPAISVPLGIPIVATVSHADVRQLDVAGGVCRSSAAGRRAELDQDFQPLDEAACGCTADRVWAVVRVRFVSDGGALVLDRPAPVIELGAIRLNAQETLWLLTGVLLVYSHLLLDINQSSLHPFYRDRLSSAYVVQAASDPGGAVDQVQPQGQKRLTDMRQNNPAVPYHLINTALNAPAGQHPSLRGRKSDIFIFSRWFSGCPSTGYFDTADLERLDPHLDLATAMAISGAAASPFMGTKKTPASLLFAVLNIRLDYWLPLPDRWRFPVIGRMPGPAYLFRQVLGQVHERSAYVNLSDGGHIENLGLYELLRRRCKFIVAIDGECDPDITCSSLVNLQRFARTDFGIEMDIDLSRVQKAEDGTVPFHFLLAKITIPPTLQQEPTAKRFKATCCI